MIRLPLLCTLLLLALAAPAAGMTQFTEYRPCDGKYGKLRRKLDKTVAHRDHVHLGMTKRAAAARTSFWSRGR